MAMATLSKRIFLVLLGMQIFSTLVSCLFSSVPFRRPINRKAVLNDVDSSNVYTDLFECESFHHVEFYCFDAKTTYKRFLLGLGMNLIAKSDLSTGNDVYSSYVLQSGDIRMIFTSPNLVTESNTKKESITTLSPSLLNRKDIPFSDFNTTASVDFVLRHGLGVRTIGIDVNDVLKSFQSITSHGGQPLIYPKMVAEKDVKKSSSSDGYIIYCEILLYGDVVLRLIERKSYQGLFLPNYCSIDDETKNHHRNDMVQMTGWTDFGLKRFDHIVGNVWNLSESESYVQNMTGFHQFAEFTADDVGTIDSGLNSVVLANLNEMILLPINEPTFGTPRKSQIQTYLEQNQGEGVQHIALLSQNIFKTLEYITNIPSNGGFELVDPPSETYYENLKTRVGDALDDEQYQLCKKYGILADKDDNGVLLQIFTKPIGDRPTLFVEIIQRIGCLESNNLKQKPGCGGFGKGNFKDLFKSIEDLERDLRI